MKRHRDNRRARSPRSEITRLEEAIRRESDKIERERLRQHREHWIRTQNSSQ